MYQVLIADDEAIVRMMLSSMIDWEEMELKLVAGVASGREAIAYLEQCRVDILITDIQMPVVDGLELIRYVVQMEHVPEILVLSAYNDFPYVRQAFKLGIYDYCLKREIHEEMLRKHLQNMKQNLLQSGRALDSGRTGGQNQDRRWLLSRLLRGEIEAEAALLPRRYYVVYFSVQGYQRLVQNFGSDFDREFFSSLLNLAGQITQISSCGVLVPSTITNLVMVYETDGGADSLPRLLRVCTRLLRAWKNYINVDVTAAVSGLGEGPGAFEDRLQEAALNLTIKYVMKSVNLFSPRDYPRFSPARACRAEKEFQEMIQALKLNDTARYESERSRILSEMQKLEPAAAGQQAVYLAYHIAAALVHQLEDSDYVYTADLLEEISKLHTSREICIWTVNFLSDMKCYMQSHYQFDFPDEIKRAVDYISSHYYNADLTLYEVAAQAGFSEKYFSTLFSKKVGMSFSAYLKSLRIHHAKNLLKSTNMRLKEISETVGYNSVEYFVRVFSAQTGMSPSAFRRQDHTNVQ